MSSSISSRINFCGGKIGVLILTKQRWLFFNIFKERVTIERNRNQIDIYTKSIKNMTHTDFWNGGIMF